MVVHGDGFGRTTIDTPDHQRFEMNRKSELLRPMIVGKDIVQYSTPPDVTAKDSMRAHHDTVPVACQAVKIALKHAKVQYSKILSCVLNSPI
jgi:hypothetical protein